VRIIAEVVDQVAPAYVEHGAGGDDRTETDLLAMAPVEDGAQERSTLAEEGDVAGLGWIFGEGGIQANRWIHDSETVGTDQAQGTTLQLLFDLLFEGSAFYTTLFESSRNHDRGLRAGIDALCNDLSNRCRRSGDYGQVYWMRDIANALVSFESEHFVMLGVDGIDFAPKGIAQQILENSPADGAGTAGGADHGHRRWSEQCVQALLLRDLLVVFLIGLDQCHRTILSGT